jgi:hypothetical protein
MPIWTFDIDEDGWSMDNLAAWDGAEGHPNVGSINLKAFIGDNGAMSISGLSSQESELTFYGIQEASSEDVVFHVSATYDDASNDDDFFTGTASWLQYTLSLNPAKTITDLAFEAACGTANLNTWIDTIDLGGEAATYAKFYFGVGPGEGVLSEKFAMPFPGVRPGAMTLNQSLGTVVIGGDEPATEAIVYSNYPYVTGTAMSVNHPTGTTVTSLKWI